MIIKKPWNITENEHVIIEICEPEIIQKLRGNCLQLSQKIPVQMYAIEQIIITVFIHVLLVVNLLLTIMNSSLIIQLNWNPPPTYFSNVLLLCHMLVTGIKLPGAVTQFNQQVVNAVTLKFE